MSEAGLNRDCSNPEHAAQHDEDTCPAGLTVCQDCEATYNLMAAEWDGSSGDH